MNDRFGGKSDPPLLQCRGLGKQYPSGAGRTIRVLRDLDLSVASGEMLAVIGASGVGKSTLLHILGALEAPDAGSIHIAGREIRSLDEQQRARLRNRNVGFVFQFHHLLPEFSALENVVMPARIAGVPLDRAALQANDLLDSVGLADRVSHRPGQLSGGEQQRVAIARALVLSPPLILADEPTGNLDADTSKIVYRLFRRLQREHGFTAVLVTHNHELAAGCDRVLRMKEGKLWETGGDESG